MPAKTAKTIILPISNQNPLQEEIDLIEALQSLDGVSTAILQEEGSAAEITIEPARTSIPTLLKAIENSGFKSQTEEITLNIGGMTCAACVVHVENALRSNYGNPACIDRQRR